MPSAPKQKSYKRHNPVASSFDPSSSSAGPSRSKPKSLEQRNEDGLPGLSKIKASIRQTRRLLAKDNLEPGLKISTQRRLASLEADLAKAERRNVEKKNGGKYHMVKFFERQKLIRLIKKSKKSLADETLKESKRSRIETDLLHARIMLNYVLHYPNEQKYISIFPPSSGDEDTKAKLPAHLSSQSEPADKSDKKRLEVLKSIQEKMERGEISATPEDEGRGSKVDLHMAGESGASKKVEKKDKEVEEEDDFFDNE